MQEPAAACLVCSQLIRCMQGGGARHECNRTGAKQAAGPILGAALCLAVSETAPVALDGFSTATCLAFCLLAAPKPFPAAAQVRNLNQEPKGWAAGDASFDAVLCCVRWGRAADTLPVWHGTGWIGCLSRMPGAQSITGQRTR